MSLFELLYLTLIITCGWISGHSLGQRLGIKGWLLGVPAGVIVPMFLTQAVLKAFYKRRPNRPGCRRGKCTSADYSTGKFTQQGVLFRCRCGDTYVRKGNRFGELSPDGSIRPYMIRATFSDWKPDE
jgi:hypothetical protein